MAIEVKEYSHGDNPQMKGKYLLEEFYKPSEDIQKHIYKVYDKYLKWRALRDMNYKWFNGITITDYLDDARKKFWGYLPLDPDVDTPQFFFPETRNQIIAILSKIANLRMKPNFEGVEGFDLVKATILNDLFEYWRRGANRKISNFWQFLYCVVNGTVIVFTGYNSKIRKVKNITLHDPETGHTEYTEEKLDESDVEDVLVNLEDFYFPKIWEPNIQEQDECVWRTLIKWSDFKDAFKGYSNADLVVPGAQFADSSIFADFLSYDVRGSDFVEVIKYFNAPLDQYSIIANGVLLNPIVNKKGEEEVSPLPWNHKKLPFSKTIFEPIDATFFYGMPLAQKVKSPQEALNRMWEYMLAREEKAINAPIITTDPSIEYGLSFKSGHIYQVQADVTQYKELKMSPTSASYWNALTALQGVVQRTGAGGASPMQTGKQPRSASENAANAQQQKETTGLYVMFYQDLIEQKVWITLMNMIQFYTARKVEKVMGDRKFHKILSLTEARMVGGGIGNHEIRITDKPMEAGELRKESYLRSLLKKEKVEIIEVTPKALQQLRFDIKINFEVENSPEAERALFLDYLTTMWNLFGQTGLLSAKKSLYRAAEKFNEPIGDIVDENVMADYEKERFGIQTPQKEQQKPQQDQGGGGQDMSALPEANKQNQSMRGQQFGAQGPMGKQGGIMRKF